MSHSKVLQRLRQFDLLFFVVVILFFVVRKLKIISQATLCRQKSQRDLMVTKVTTSALCCIQYWLSIYGYSGTGHPGISFRQVFALERKKRNWWFKYRTEPFVFTLLFKRRPRGMSVSRELTNLSVVLIRTNVSFSSFARQFAILTLIAIAMVI